jgi:crotonobetainyl-CoA:carnitine CoA-transferase CaiB-like acyl-CoA transferase
MSITGEPSGPPSKTGLSAVDFATGFAAGLALMTGIHAARRDGIGCDCDVSLLDTAMSMLNYLATWTGTSGYEPERMVRSAHPTLVPFMNFPTADGWIVAGGSKEKFWARMAEALGLSELVHDPRFATFDDRRLNRDVLIPILDERFLSQTTQHWLQVLEAAGVPCGPVNSVEQAMRDPQVVDRGIVFTLPHPVFGDVTHVGSPIRVGSTPHKRLPSPLLGADTEPVLTDLLGYSPKRVRELADAGAIGGPGLTD